MYDLIGEKEKEESAEDVFRFSPVGGGKVNMPEVLDAVIGTGAKWVVVEQDSSLTQPMFEAVKMSRDYLKSRGW